MSEDAQDVSMQDEDIDVMEQALLGKGKKLVVLPGASTHAASFQVEKEDHTLGNALRYFINKKVSSTHTLHCLILSETYSPDVEFCGYTIPHPSETKMNIRIQTWADRSVEDTQTTAFDALRKGLIDMMEACDVVVEKFTQARDEFDAAQAL